MTGDSLPGTTIASVLLGEAHQLKPEQFIWSPGISPTGSVVILVILDGQLVWVYRNGLCIGISTCSTGKSGHETPVGVFPILEKDRVHYSSIYNNAPMPNSQRLTWGGVAIHGGNLPGYPASHGCIRLPLEFSALLFEITRLGTPVLITKKYIDDQKKEEPGFIFDNAKLQQLAKRLSGENKLKTSETPDIAISAIVSSDGAQFVLLENGDITAEGTVPSLHNQMHIGEHIFLAQETEGDKNLTWETVDDKDKEDMPPSPLIQEVLEYILSTPRFPKAGLNFRMTLILTDHPLTSL